MVRVRARRRVTVWVWDWVKAKLLADENAATPFSRTTVFSHETETGQSWSAGGLKSGALRMNPVPLTQHPSIGQDPGCTSPCIPQLFAHRLLPQAPVRSKLCEESMGWDPARTDHLKMTNPALQQIF